jgi:hypothetical protein
MRWRQVAVWVLLGLVSLYGSPTAVTRARGDFCFAVIASDPVNFLLLKGLLGSAKSKGVLKNKAECVDRVTTAVEVVAGAVGVATPVSRLKAQFMADCACDQVFGDEPQGLPAAAYFSGEALDVAVGPNDVPLRVGLESEKGGHSVYVWRGPNPDLAHSRWEKLDRGGVKVDVDTQGRILLLTDRNELIRQKQPAASSGGFQPAAMQAKGDWVTLGQGIKAFAIGPHDAVFAIRQAAGGNGNELVQLIEFLQLKWEPVSTAPLAIRALAVDDRSRAWIVDSANSVQRLDTTGEKKWTPVDGLAQDITASVRGVFAIGGRIVSKAGHELLEWSEPLKWVALPAPLAAERIRAGQNCRGFVINADGQIWKVN